MPVWLLSNAQREQLSWFPAEIDDESRDRFFMLSGAYVAKDRHRHGNGNRLGWSLRLCELRILGFCPDDVTMTPACRPDALIFSPLMLLPDLGSDGQFGGFGVEHR